MNGTTGADVDGDAVWLGIDVGTQGVRVVAVDGSGAVLGSGSAPLHGDHRSGNRHEQDPHEWWASLCAASRACLTGLPGRHVGAVAIDATSGTVVVQDRLGRSRGPAVMYDDGRAVREAVLVQDAGSQLWQRLGYRMQPSWALPKLLWLQRSGAFGAHDRIAHQADHLAGRLVGSPVASDTSNCLKTGYDLLDPSWPHDVLDAVGLDVGLLPDVVLPGAVLGSVSAAGAAESGIPAGTPVKAGMTDGCAAQIASGSLTPGSWSSALGTTLVIKGATRDLVADPAGSVYCHLNPDGGWLPGGASSTGAGIIAREFAGDDLDALSSAAAAHLPAPGVRYPLLGRGERFPFVAPDAEGFAIDVPVDPASRFASTIQGIALLERLAYQHLASLGADVSGPVTLTGGAAANTVWNQLRSDILRRPVLVPESAEAALGMAVLAAAPAGGLAVTARRMVRTATSYEPDETRSARFDEPYVQFERALSERGWLPERAARA